MRRFSFFLALLTFPFVVVAQDTTFRMESLALEVENPKNLVVIDAEGPDLTISLSYEGQIEPNMRLKAALQGPGLASPLFVDQPATDLSLVFSNTTFVEEGEYHLTGLRLEKDDRVIAVSQPRVTTIQAVEELLITGASVEEITQAELAEQGFAFNEADYRAVKFNVNLVMGSNEIIETFNVLLPRESELRKTKINNVYSLSNPLKSPNNFKAIPVRMYDNSFVSPYDFGMNSLEPDWEAAATEGYQVYALLLVPGELSYFKGHFNVSALVLNDTPEGFDVRVSNLEAEITLPDPTRFGYPLKIRDKDGDPVRTVSRDEATDSGLVANYLDPGEEGRASFLLTGEQPGMWDVQIDIRGKAALPQGDIQVKAETSAKVLVRSREFAVSFEHPATVGEIQDYDFLMKVYNKSNVAIEGLSVTLDPETLIGTELQPSTDPQQTIPVIAPGETGVFTFGMRSLLNGTVTATYHRISDGSDSSLSLSVGVGNDEESLTAYSVAFPERFDEVVPTQLNQAFRVYAKKLIDFAQTEPERMPKGIGPLGMNRARAFFQSLSHSAVFLDWVSPDLSASYTYDSDTALLTMLATYLENETGYESLDKLRRHLLESSSDAWDLELAFSQIMQTRFATMNAEALLTRLSYETQQIENLRVALLEGEGLDDLTVTGSQGMRMTSIDSNKVRTLPYSSMLRISPTRVLVWTALNAEEIRLHFGDAADTSLTLSGILTKKNGRRQIVTNHAIDRNVDPTIVFSANGKVQVVTNQGDKLGKVAASPLAERPFSLIGIRQLDPLVLGQANKFVQERKENYFLENGRYFMLAFSEPVDMGSLHPLNEHLNINGVGAFKAYAQNDPRLVIVVSSQIVGNNFPITYDLKGVTSNQQTASLPGNRTTGTFLGSDWLRGAYVRGRITDHHGTDLSKAKVYLTFAGEKMLLNNGNGRNSQHMSNLHRYHDVVDVNYDGTYQIDFVKINREFIADLAGRTTQSGVPSYKNTSQITVVLEDGRYKVHTFYTLTSGQEVPVDIVFNAVGTVWGEVRNQAGEPQKDVPVYVTNQNTNSGARVVYTNQKGVYTVEGIEMGPISVRTQVDSYVALETGYMSHTNNPLRLDLQPHVERGSLLGRVMKEVDGEMVPVPQAMIVYEPASSNESNVNEYLSDRFSYLGINAYAVTYTNPDGYYHLPSIPAGLAKVTTFFTGVSTQTTNVIVAANTDTEHNVNFTEQNIVGGYIQGQVRKPDGTPAPNVHVSTVGVGHTGSYAYTDENGHFELHSVILNRNLRISANSRPGANPFLRGAYFVTLTDEVPEQTNIVIPLLGDTSVEGQYWDSQGEPMPFRPVKMFSTTYGEANVGPTDQHGYFSSELTAYQPGLWTIGSPDYPRVTYQEVYIRAGENNYISLRQEGFESLAARLIDGHGNPVIGQIVVESVLPDVKSGMGVPKKVVSHTYFSDLDTATIFRDINYGSVTIYGKHPILGTTQRYTFEHRHNPSLADLREIVLSFPRSEPGRLHGFVYNADGTPAPAGTLVHATFDGVKGTVLCNEGGYYNFQSLVSTLQPKRVELFANHTDSERFAYKQIFLNQNLNMRSDLILRGKGSVSVRVVDSEGAPVDVGDLVIRYDGYSSAVPQSISEAMGNGNFDLEGVSAEELNVVVVSYFKQTENVRLSVSQPVQTFNDIQAGSITVHAQTGAGLAGFAEAAMPVEGGDIEVVVRLEAGSTIRGTFVDENDQPIADAQVDFSFNSFVLGSVTTGSEGLGVGTFEISGLPMRTYLLRATQPDTAFEGDVEVTTSAFQPEPNVTLKLTPLGHIDGAVINEDTGLPAVSANVIIHLDRHRKLETATDTAGLFRFENLPLGDYPIEVTSPYFPGVGSGLASITQAGEVAQLEVRITGGNDLVVQVLEDDGEVQPGQQVALEGVATSQFKKVSLNYVAITDAEGIAVFRNLPAGSYKATCNISTFGKRATEQVSIDGSRQTQHVTLQMPSLFTLRGTVRDSLDMVPSGRVTVSISQFNGNVFIKTASINLDGDYSIPGIPYGHGYEVFAFDLATGNTVRTEQFSHLNADGSEKIIDLELKAVTSASGYVRNQAGEPVANAKVWVETPIPIVTYTNSLGEFTIHPYLDATTTVFAKDPASPRLGAAMLPKPESISSGLLPLTDQEITLGAMFSLQGTVRLNDGTPLLGVEVSATHQETQAQFEIPVTQNGAYSFDFLPAGPYHISAYDIIRREFLETPIVIESQTDDEILQQDITFQPNYYVAGRVRNGLGQFEPNAVVEIFRFLEQNGREGYYLVDATETNEDGFFNFEVLYPGAYRLHTENALQTLSKTIDFTLGNASREDIIIDLIYESSFLVSVKTPSDLPYKDARLDLFRSGKRYEAITLSPDGIGEIPRITTEITNYELSLNNGWYKETGVFNLQPGPNFYEIIGPEVIKLSGIAIYQSESGGVPIVKVRINDVSRNANILADGYFEAYQVPANTPVTVTLSKAGASKSFDYAGFSQDTDLGTLTVSGERPVLTPVAETMTVSSLPHTFVWNVTHPGNEGELIDPNHTQFSAGLFLGSRFDVETIGNQVQVTLQPEKATFERGDVELRLHVAREDGLLAKHNQVVSINPAGTTLMVFAKNNYSFGSYSLDGGHTWVTVQDSGQIVLPNLTQAEVHLVVRDPFQENAGRLDMLMDPIMMVQTQYLHHAPYAGFQGTVYLPDGVTPAANVRLEVDDYWETTDENGQYYFDFLPVDLVNSGFVKAYKENRLGAVNPTQRAVPHQVLSGTDIVLKGRSQLEILAYQADGITPVPNATLRVGYTDYPFWPDLEIDSVLDENARWSSDQVLATDFEVTLFDEVTGLYGYATGTFVAENTTQTVTVTMEPAYSVSGIIVDQAGLAVEGAEVFIKASNEFLDQTVTDASGTFSLTGIANYQSVALMAIHRDRKISRTAPLNFVTSDIDLGNWALEPDTAPTFREVIFPQTLFVGQSPSLQAEFDDDFAFKQVTYALSGVVTYEATQTFELVQKRDYIYDTESFPIPEGTPPGEITLTITLEDQLGQTATQAYTLDYIEDHVGPQITVNAPNTADVFTEGDLIRVSVIASDAAGVAHIGIYWQQELLAETDRYSLVTDIFAVPVAANQAVDYTVRATDNAGNTSELIVPIQINARTTTEAPLAQLRYPIDGMPLPMSSVSPLQIPIRLHTQDSAGLQRYELLFEGALIDEGWLYGDQAPIDLDWTLPESYTTAPQVTFTLRVWNLGDQLTEVQATVNNIEGTIYDAANPLILAEFDQQSGTESVILNGGEHHIDGTHTFANMVLVNGASLTQRETDPATAWNALTDLQVTQHFVLAADAMVDVQATGYPSSPPFMLENTYGGHSGIDYNDDTFATVYGSMIQPSHPGSSYGGGVFHLETSQAWLGGLINAKPSSTGSGGSIQVQAASLAGFGEVNADGHAEDGFHNISGSGGRIFMQAPTRFQGLLTASSFGRGAGTLYERIEDATKPDGFYDVLSVKRRHSSTRQNEGPSLIMGLKRTVGDNLTVEHNVQESPETPVGDVLRISQSDILPRRYFAGFEVWVNGTNRTTVTRQSLNDLWLPAGSLGTIQNGDQIEVKLPIDELVVSGTAIALIYDQPVGQITLDDGMLIGLGDVQTEAVFVNGKGEMVMNRLASTAFNIPNQAELGFMGHLETAAFTLGSDASLTMLNQHFYSRWHDVLEQNNLPQTDLAGLGYLASLGIADHAGDGPSGTEAIGSPYQPQTYSRSVHLRVIADSAHIDGAIELADQDVERGAAGSLWLSAQTLSGSGLISANGRYGGGRVALWVDDPAGFTGQVQAQATSNGGAGTIYWKTLAHPKGRLIIDNGGLAAPPASTYLDGLGARTFSSEASGNTLTITDLPDYNALAGMYLAIGEDEPIAIASHTNDTLYLDQPLAQTYAANTAFAGRHVLDELVLAGGASMTSVDPIYADVVTYAGGSSNATIVETGADGGTFTLESGNNTTFEEDPGYSHYVVDGGHLQLNFPVNAASLTLQNNATLTYFQAIDFDEITVTDSTVICAIPYETLDDHTIGVTAQNLTMTNATWRGWSYTEAGGLGDWYVTRLNFLVHQSASIDANSIVGLTASEQMPRAIFDWYGESVRADLSHAGIRSDYSGNWSNNSLGSVSEPTFVGQSGAVYLKAQHLHLDGVLQAAFAGQTTGGSVWVDTQTGSGTGQIKVSEGSDMRGGRLAIYHAGSGDFIDQWQLQAKPTTTNSDKNAGTIFIKSDLQAYGSLILDQGRSINESPYVRTRQPYATGITGPETITLNLADDNADPLIVVDRSRNDLPFSLAGLWARFNVDAIQYDVRIAANTHNSLTFEPPPSGPLPPAILPQGTTMQLVLKLDRLDFRNGGQLTTEGIVQVSEIVGEESGAIGTLHVESLELPSPFTLENVNLQLWLRDQDLANIDLQLVDSQLWLTKPLHLNNLDLVRSKVAHTQLVGNTEEIDPKLDLTVNVLSMDVNSRFDVSGIHDHPGSFGQNHGYGSPGSISQPDMYGSFLRPDMAGQRSGGGRIHLKATQVDGGTFWANGPNSAEHNTTLGSGGSVWIEAQSFTGTIDVQANHGDHVTVGGGGRIALDVDDLSGATLTTSADGGYSSGTVLIKTAGQSYGSLFIPDPTSRSSTASQYDKLTPLPSFGHISAPADIDVQYDGQADQTTVSVSSWTDPIRYDGYDLVVGDAVSLRYPIIEQTIVDDTATFIVAGEVIGLQEGTSIRLGATLDSFEPCADCVVPTGPLSLRVTGDNTAPEVTGFGLLSGQTWVDSGTSFEVVGTIADDTDVDRYVFEFNGETYVYYEADTLNLNFTAPIVTSDTLMPMMISAYDGNGNLTQQTLNLNVVTTDTTAPTITIVKPTLAPPLEGGSVMQVEVDITDNRLLQSVTFDFAGQSETQETNQTTGNFVTAFTTPIYGGQQIEQLLITAIDALGNQQTRSLNVTLADVTPPAEVLSLFAAPAEDSITWTWSVPVDTHSDLAAVNVYVNGNVTPQTLAANSNSFTLNDLGVDETHEIRVTTLDGSGNESAGVSSSSTTIQGGAGSLPVPTAFYPMDVAPSRQNIVDFDRTDGILATGAHRALAGKTGFTAAVWLKADTYSGGYILDMHRKNNSNSISLLRIQEYSNAFRVYHYREGGSNHSINAYATPYRDGQWHRLVVVADYVAGFVKVYMDNLEIASKTLNAAEMRAIDEDLNHPFAVGSNHVGSYYYYNGNMYDLQLWNQAWSVADIAHDYQNSQDLVSDRSGSSLNEHRNLVLRWLLNEGQGQTVADSSGYGNAGTSVKGTLKWSGEPAPAALLPNQVDQGAWVHANGDMAAGRFGSAMKLDRSLISNGKQETALVAPPPYSGSWTVSGYFLLDELPSSEALPAKLLKLGNSNALNLEVNTQDQLELHWDSDSQVVGSALSTNTWYAVAMVVDGNQAQLYLDGAKIGTPFSLTNWSLIYGPWSSGGDTTAFRLDELTLWDQGLAETQIQSIVDAYTAGESLYAVSDVAPQGEIRNLVLNATSNGLDMRWDTPDWGTANLHTGYRLYLNGSQTPIALPVGTTQYLYGGYSENADLNYTLSVVYGPKESQGVSGTFKAKATPMAASSISTPDSHWDGSSDRLGQAKLLFDGTYYLKAPEYSDLVVNENELTASFWYKGDFPSNRTRELMIISDPANQNAYVLRVVHTSSGTLYAFLKRSTGGSVSVGGTVPFDGEWHKVHAVTNWNTGTFALYFDGTLVEAESYPSDPVGSPITTAPRYLTFGTSQYRSSHLLDSYIQDAQIWTKAFTAEDAAFDANNYMGLATDRSGSSLQNSDLKARWPLTVDDTSLVDATGNGYDLVATQSTTWQSTDGEPVPALQDWVQQATLFAGGAKSVSGVSAEGFNAKAATLTLETPATWQTTNGFSVTTFFRVDADAVAAGKTTQLIARETQQGTFALQIDANGKLIALLPSGEAAIAAAGKSLTDWVHLALTYAANGTLQVYLDGQSYLELNASGSWTDALSDWFVAGNGRDTFRPSYAEFDEITAWNRALTAAEVMGVYTIYQNGDNLANALGLNGGQARGEGDDSPNDGGTFGDDKPTQSLPDGAEAMGEDAWALRNQETTVDSLIVDGDFWLIGGELVVQGEIQARSLYLRDGAVLTLAPQAETHAPTLRINLLDTLDIDARSHVNLDGVVLHTQPQAPNLAHAGYALAADRGQLKGAILMPQAQGGGARGGGAFLLTATELILNGQLTARGLIGSAGGSIWLNLNELRGYGSMDVSGGQSDHLIAGGGRVAIYADTVHRFNGSIVTGLNSATEGSLVVAKRDGSQLILDRSFPLQQRMPELPDAVELKLNDVEVLGKNSFGDLLRVASKASLTAYKGAWLEAGAQRVRVVDVVHMGDHSYLIQLQGHLDNTNFQMLRFVIQTQKPATIPNRIPLIQER